MDKIALAAIWAVYHVAYAMQYEDHNYAVDNGIVFG